MSELGTYIGSIALPWHNEKMLALLESEKKKYGSKYLKLPKSSRNPKKKKKFHTFQKR